MKLAVRDQHEMVLKLYLATPPPYEISRITDAMLTCSAVCQVKAAAAIL